MARRVLDEQTLEKIEELYAKGYSISRIARELGLNWRTVKKYLLQNRSAEEDTQKTEEVEEEPMEEQILEEIPKDIKNSARRLEKDMEEFKVARERVMSYIRDFEEEIPPDIKEIVDKIEEYRKREQYLQRYLARLMGRYTPTTPGAQPAPATPEAILTSYNEYKEKLEQMERDARAFLEKLGYIVIKTGEDIEALVETVKKLGYEVIPRHLTREEVQKLIEEERKKMEEEFREKLSRELEEKKIDAATRMIEYAVDRFASIFSAPVQRFAEEASRKYVERRKKTRKALEKMRNIPEEVEEVDLNGLGENVGNDSGESS